MLVSGFRVHAIQIDAARIFFFLLSLEKYRKRERERDIQRKHTVWKHSCWFVQIDRERFHDNRFNDYFLRWIIATSRFLTRVRIKNYSLRRSIQWICETKHFYHRQRMNENTIRKISRKIVKIVINGRIMVENRSVFFFFCRNFEHLVYISFLNRYGEDVSVSVRLEKKRWRDLHGKGGAAFEFAIIIGNPSERGGGWMGKICKSPWNACISSFFLLFFFWIVSRSQEVI